MMVSADMGLSINMAANQDEAGLESGIGK